MKSTMTHKLTTTRIATALSLVVVTVLMSLAANGAGASTVNFGTLTPFTGGDAGEGLDLSGDIVYAFNFGELSATKTIQGVDFVPSDATSEPTGITIVSGSPGSVFNFSYFVLNGSSNAAEYGASTSDDALEDAMTTVWAENDWTFDLTVTPGTAYKLQLILQEGFFTFQGGTDRDFDISVETASPSTLSDAVTDLELGTETDGAAPAQPGADFGLVYTYTFTADDSLFRIGLSTNTLNDAIVNALTLEQLPVPEPSTLSLAAIGLLGLLFCGRRRKRYAEARGRTSTSDLMRNTMKPIRSADFRHIDFFARSEPMNTRNRTNTVFTLAAVAMAAIVLTSSSAGAAPVSFDDFSTDPNLAGDWTEYTYHNIDAVTTTWNSIDQDLDFVSTASTGAGTSLIGLYRTGTARSATDPVTLTVKSFSQTGGSFGYVGLMISDVAEPTLLGSEEKYEWHIVDNGSGSKSYRVRKDVGTGSFDLFTEAFTMSGPVKLDIVRVGDDYQFLANDVLKYTADGTGLDVYSVATKDSLVNYEIIFGGDGPATTTVDDFGVLLAAAVPEPASMGLLGLASLMGLCFWRPVRKR